MSSEGREETSKEYVSTVHDSRGSWKENIDTPSSASESGEEEEGDLKVKLLTSMEESQFEKTQGRYLPRNKFDEIFCPQPERKDGRIPAIFEPMGLSLVTPTDEDLSLVDHVLEHCRILFLIAVYIELNPEPLRTLMSIFRRDKFTDKRLPIDIWPMRKLKAGIKKHPFHPFVEMEQRHEPTRTLRIWDLKSIEKFQSEQWNFLIPIISTTEIFHDFRHCRIPFVARHEVVGKGGNGIVYQYTIHEAHFNDPPPLLPINTDEIVSPISMNNLPLPTHLENPPLPINMDNPPPPFKTNNIPALINMIEASPAISAQRAKTAIVAVKELRKGNEVAKRWEKEVKALARMNGFNHKHIVRFITSFQRRNTSDDIDYYVVFEWADGGNLSTFRAAYPHPELTAVLIKWVIQQLYGLAQALSKAHYLDEEGSYRHGDLKPANILWFKQGDTEFGTLKIGDWGEAKEHYNGTAYRRDTTAQYGTRRYEPPEVSTGLKLNLSRDSKFARSRLYDIWGIGCITLEFIIWLMYGLDTLKNFNRLNIGDYGVSDMFYEVSLGKPAKVHAVARHWMNHMAKDPRCSRNKTALGDLLEIVRTGLLIVKLPPEGGAKRPHLQSNPSSEALNLESNRFRPSTDTAEIVGIGHGKDIAIQVTQDLEDPVLANPGEPRRCLATDFESELLRISKVKDESYWYQEYISKPTPVGARSSDFLSVNPGPIASTRNVSGLRYNGSELENYGTKDRADLHTWRFECDNTFAKGIFSRLKNLGLPPPRAIPVSENLCNQCMAVGGRLWSPFFEETYNMELLERNASKGECDLCVILWNTDPESRYPASPQVKFRRQGSMITMDGLKPPVLALFQNNEPRSQASDVQIGFADLPTPGQDVHTEVLRRWLNDCDRVHKCRPMKVGRVGVPTRLIDVGTDDSAIVHLREIDPSFSDDWVALSYRWGPTPHFSTTTETIKTHLAGMSWNQLPHTFQDAIKITRSLEKRYLWIDSLCIIQGEGGDFKEESKRMEDVYSGAYCVLAASRATEQRSGFLFSRQEARKYVTLKADEDTDSVYYVSERIEKFKEHVLDGELCQRGWVYQEHALARRTIFFTEHQTYWECGEGIRCETLSKMSNTYAAFLGDPEFPKLLNPDTAKKGEQIYQSQELYRKYSGLDLTSQHDRPAAIDGLQKRLLRAMKVKGGFGLFDDPDNLKNKGFLRRSLLWRREDSTLRKIEFPEDCVLIPSWSWMSVSGAIDYFHPSFTEFEWQDVESPWSSPIQADKKQIIKAKVRNFQLPDATSEDHEIVYDDSNRSKQERTRAIVLGIERSREVAEARHYVLFVDMMAECTPDGSGHEYCTRAGAGYLPGKWLEGTADLCALI